VVAIGEGFVEAQEIEALAMVGVAAIVDAGEDLTVLSKPHGTRHNHYMDSSGSHASPGLADDESAD
jgi:hypothetical protein